MKYWILLSIAAGAVVWAFIPFLAPQAPFLVSPEDFAFQRGHVPNTTVALQWRHGGRQLSNPRARPAAYFVMCVDDPAVVEEKCGEGSAENFVMEWQAPAAIQRSPIGSSMFTPVPYEYTHDIEVPETALDRELQWTVGACRSENNLQSCNFATPSRRLSLNATDLKADRIDDDVTNTKLTIKVELANLGETDFAGGEYRVATDVWEIIPNPENCTLPLTNVNLLDNPATDGDESINFSVIKNDGTTDSVLNLPLMSGVRDTSDVYAVIRLNGIKKFWAYEPTVPEDTDGLASAALNDGDIKSIKPCPSSQRNGGLAGDCVIDVPDDPAFSQRAFASRTRIDPQGTIAEFDETNNQAMRNDTRIFNSAIDSTTDTEDVCVVNLFEQEE